MEDADPLGPLPGLAITPGSILGGVLLGVFLIFLLAFLLALYGEDLLKKLAAALHLPWPEKHPTLSEEELKALLDRSETPENGTEVISEAEHDLIENVFAFGDKTVSEVMTHRLDLSALPEEASLADALALIDSDKYSRIPVYREDIDHIVGLVNARDILFYAATAGVPEDSQNLKKTPSAPADRHARGTAFHLRNFLREALYTPETAKIAALFRRMQNEHAHMMVVIDEYGGTAGVVTMEDVLEELVGQIQDEYDEEEPEAQPLGENTWLVDGSLSLSEISELLAVELPSEDYDTVAGLVMDALGRIPEEGEEVCILRGHLQIRIIRMDGRRIEKLQISRS